MNNHNAQGTVLIRAETKERLIELLYILNFSFADTDSGLSLIGVPKSRKLSHEEFTIKFLDRFEPLYNDNLGVYECEIEIKYDTLSYGSREYKSIFETLTHWSNPKGSYAHINECRYEALFDILDICAWEGRLTHYEICDVWDKGEIIRDVCTEDDLEYTAKNASKLRDWENALDKQLIEDEFDDIYNVACKFVACKFTERYDEYAHLTRTPHIFRAHIDNFPTEIVYQGTNKIWFNLRELLDDLKTIHKYRLESGNIDEETYDLHGEMIESLESKDIDTNDLVNYRYQYNSSDATYLYKLYAECMTRAGYPLKQFTTYRNTRGEQLLPAELGFVHPEPGWHIAGYPYQIATKIVYSPEGAEMQHIRLTAEEKGMIK